MGERFADVNVVTINGILNAQRYRDEILRSIVVPFIHEHHLMLLHDNARPHDARICTQFLEAENIPVLAWPAYSPDMSPIEHVWDALDRRIRQHVPVHADIHQDRLLCLHLQGFDVFLNNPFIMKMNVQMESKPL